MLTMLSSAEFHKDFVALRIATSEVGINGLPLSSMLKQDAISALIFEPTNKEFSWSASSPAQLQFFIERESDHSFKVRVEGELLLSCICVRCLNPLEVRLTLDFSVRMLSREHFEVDDSENSWQFDSTDVDMSANEESTVGYFTDKCIDLGVILRDQIFSEVPDYPHCGGQDSTGALDCGPKARFLVNPDEHQSNPFVKHFNKTK